MAIYQGVNGVNREVKQIFQGIEGVNRETKERWEGVGGVNRQVFVNRPAGALYWDGDECVTLTGGWIITKQEANSSVIKNANNIYMEGRNTGGTYSHAVICANNIFDLSKYSLLKCEMNVNSIDNTNKANVPWIGVSTSKQNHAEYWLGENVRYINAKGVGQLELILDISGITNNLYIVIATKNSAKCYINKVWLE